MAGMFRVSLWKFAAMDGGGAGLWAGSFLFAGWCFHPELEVIGGYLDLLRGWLGLSVAVALAVYVTFKYIQSQWVYRSLRVARISPLELKRRMDSGEAITIVDLRHTLEWKDGRIPG